MPKLPIQVESLDFVLASIPEPVIDFESKQPRVDLDGQPVFGFNVVALSAEGGGEIWPVKVAGQLSKDLKIGSLIKLTGLVANVWDFQGKHGISFKVESVSLLSASSKAPTSA